MSHHNTDRKFDETFGDIKRKSVFQPKGHEGNSYFIKRDNVYGQRYYPNRPDGMEDLGDREEFAPTHAVRTFDYHTHMIRKRED